MASLVVDRDRLVVHLSPLEKVGALHGDVRVPLAAVRDVQVTDDPWSQLRGMRAPGTGWPGRIALGTRRGRGVKDFAAVYGMGKGVVVELEGAAFRRLVVSAHDASAAVERIAEATKRVR